MTQTVSDHEVAAVVAADERRAERIDRIVGLIQRQGALAVLVVVVVIGAVAFPNFRSFDNAATILIAAAPPALIALGMTFVIITGGIDLSVGSLYVLGGVVSAYASQWGLLPAFLAPLAVCGLIGLLNGALIAYSRMAPFIVTLAALLAIRALAVATAGESLVIADPGFFATIANGNLLGVGTLVWILLVAYAGAALVLNRTAFGTAVFAIGGNEEAARMMGLRVEQVTILAYCGSGALAGLTGALLAAHLDSGLSAAGTGYELPSIAAAVIGGVLLTGGVGTMSGALSGALLLGLIDNVINQIGTLSAYYQGLVSGAFLLLAVVVQAALSRGRAA